MDTTVKIRGLWRVAKYWADDDPARAQPHELVEAENLVTTTGAQALWNRLAGLGSVTAFDATNARLAVGDSATAADVAQTDLLGTNKTRKLVDSAPVVSGRGISYVATFGTTDANYAWNEAGLANAAAAGILLNRVVQAFGTKTSAAQWVLTCSIVLASS